MNSEHVKDIGLTAAQAAEQLGVSKRQVYTLAKRFEWRVEQINGRKHFNVADVISTPDAEERKALGYAGRQSRELYAEDKSFFGSFDQLVKAGLPCVDCKHCGSDNGQEWWCYLSLILPVAKKSCERHEKANQI